MTAVGRCQVSLQSDRAGEVDTSTLIKLRWVHGCVFGLVPLDWL